MIEEFRKTSPVPLAPKPFNIPQPFETQLENGLRVIIFENRRLPIINFRLAFLSGEVNDPLDSKGLTAAMASLLTQGTENYSSRELAEEAENLGASLHASSSSDNTIASASALVLYRSEMLKLLAEIVLRPSFPESELNLYKENVIKGLEFQRSQADFLADEQSSRIIFGDHPYSRVSPKREEIEAITREKLVEFHKQRLIPNNAILIVVGDIESNEFLVELDQAFGEWKPGNIEVATFSAPPIRKKRTLTIVDRVGSAQSNIILSNLGMERTNPDYFAVLVMNQILGAGASSRLFMNIREDKGYTYGAYSSFDSRRLTGAFEASAEVRTAVTAESLKEFFYELERIRDEKVTDDEIQDAKNFLTGVFPIRAETQEGLTNLIVSQKLYGLPGDYLQTYRDNINAVTLDEIQGVANKYIQPDKISLVIVGDAEEILKQARSYADEIEIFDTEGIPQELTKYETTGNAIPADIDGSWNVTIEFQGQNVPVTFEIKQNETAFSGEFQSPLGTGKISEGNINGGKVKGKILLNLQGQDVEISLNAAADRESIKGILTSEMEGLPDLPFTGIRS